MQLIYSFKAYKIIYPAEKPVLPMMKKTPFKIMILSKRPSQNTLKMFISNITTNIYSKLFKDKMFTYLRREYNLVQYSLDRNRQKTRE